MDDHNTSSARDEGFLHQAIALAMKARGRAEPNPMVGCVIVKGAGVIGQGFHEEFGGAHAEPNALGSCTESPVGGTAYVTLEPCSHREKKTPPCAPRLIEAGIARVVFGCVDPNPAVNGNGLRMLRDAGITVDGPVLEKQSMQLIAPFIARQKYGRPYVTLKWAESADGKVAGAGGTPVRISNSRSHALVHLLRSRSDAIMVGINTVLADDPMLTARGIDTHRPLRRIVLDSLLRIPENSRLVQTAGEWPTTVIFFPGIVEDPSKLGRLSHAGVEVLEASPGRDGRPDLAAVLRNLSGTMHLLVEPGPTLAKGFFESSQVDRLWVIKSPRRIGEAGVSATRVPDHYIATGTVDIAGDQLTEYLNPHGEVFFSPDRSADLLTAEERGQTSE